MAKHARDAAVLTGQGQRRPRTAAAVPSHVELCRQAEQRGSTAEGVDAQLAAADLRHLGYASGQADETAEAIVEGQYRAPAPPRVQSGVSEQNAFKPPKANQRLILVDDPERQSRLAGTQQRRADIDHLHLFLALPTRTVGDGPQHIQARRQRHIEEFVAAIDRLIGAAAQHVIYIEFNVVTRWQLSAQVDAVEDVGLVNRRGGK